MRIFRKLKRIINLILHPRFAFIKYKTKGYLSPKVYHCIYKYGYKAPEGHAIDIGSAQGGTAISLGLGYETSNKSNDFFIYSIEKGSKSNALIAQDNIAFNEKVLRDNISSYNLSQRVNVIMSTSDQAFEKQGVPDRVAVLSIDTDGALDRDFRIFYNSLTPSARIILDDYEDVIDSHGKQKLAMSEEKIANFLKEKGLESFSQTTPLGKKYTIYRFVNYMIEEGLIEMDKVIDNTFFGVKPEKAPQFSEKNLQDMKDIRAQIEKDFWNLKQ